jgi:hypothetical protein
MPPGYASCESTFPGEYTRYRRCGLVPRRSACECQVHRRDDNLGGQQGLPGCSSPFGITRLQAAKQLFDRLLLTAPMRMAMDE